MLYCAQRLARNDRTWLTPTPGRLGRNGEGAYVREYGFGHEDWNFNARLAIRGFVYGYSYFQPREDAQGDYFHLAFVTRERGNWYLAGFYLNAEYVPDGAPADTAVILQKARDLYAIRDALGTKRSRLSEERLREVLAKESAWLRWRVRPQDIIRLPEPRILPEEIFKSSLYRISVAKYLSESEFLRLRAFAESSAPSPSPDAIDVERAFVEGRPLTAVHLIRERAPALVRLAKQRFRTAHGSLFCEACGFDFATTYGTRGADFIEAHHVLPVSKLTGSTEMRPEDLRMLCSNCHRMVHAEEPWLDVDDLRQMVANSRQGIGG